MSAAHHGHIICLYAGRAVYCPKMATLQATLKAALECFGLENGRDVHFGFPHSDLAILVEISLAFKNVRDGAILYLCDGTLGPVYPHELAHQAQQGQARRLTRAEAAAAARAANAPANDAEPANARGGAARQATRSSRRLRRQTHDAPTNDGATAEERAAPANTRNKETPPDATHSEAGDEHDQAASASTSTQSSAKRAKREPEDDVDVLASQYQDEGHNQRASGSPSGDAYFKR